MTFESFLQWAGWAIGVFTGGLAIYQWAILNEHKRSLKNMQYLLAAMNSSALTKQVRWMNLVTLLPSPSTPADLELRRVCELGRADMADIAQQAFSLERSIDASSSAIRTLQDEAVQQQNRAAQVAASSMQTPQSPVSQSGLNP